MIRKSKTIYTSKYIHSLMTRNNRKPVKTHHTSVRLTDEDRSFINEENIVIQDAFERGLKLYKKERNWKGANH